MCGCRFDMPNNRKATDRIPLLNHLFRRASLSHENAQSLCRLPAVPVLKRHRRWVVRSDEYLAASQNGSALAGEGRGLVVESPSDDCTNLLLAHSKETCGRYGSGHEGSRLHEGAPRA